MDRVAAERLEGSRVLVYATHTGTRVITERMDDILTRHGLRVARLKRCTECGGASYESRRPWVPWRAGAGWGWEPLVVI